MVDKLYVPSVLPSIIVKNLFDKKIEIRKQSLRDLRTFIEKLITKNDLQAIISVIVYFSSKILYCSWVVRGTAFGSAQVDPRLFLSHRPNPLQKSQRNVLMSFKSSV
jgi:hypothetical protein